RLRAATPLSVRGARHHPGVPRPWRGAGGGHSEKEKWGIVSCKSDGADRAPRVRAKARAATRTAANASSGVMCPVQACPFSGAPTGGGFLLLHRSRAKPEHRRVNRAFAQARKPATTGQMTHDM